MITHRGGCHCGAVAFTFTTPSANLVAWDCNCSICAMKRNVHAIVPAAAFTLLTPPARLSEYRFGTCTARHLFCSTCGICAFYHPRSNPDGVAVTVACIAPGTVRAVEVRAFDGRNWEAACAATAIAAASRAPFRFAALLSDLDGTLLDTEPIYFEAYAKAAAQLGLQAPYTLAFHAEHLLGKPEAAGAAAFVARLGLPPGTPAARVLELRDAHALPAFAAASPALPGAEAAVRACLGAGLRAAVVTSSKRKLVELKRRGAPRGLLELFEAVFCSDDAALAGAPGKPHPRCYLRAAEELRVPPGECLVFEDSVAGMVAGVEAGCFVVGVPDAALDGAAVAASGAHVVLEGGLASFRFEKVLAAAAAWAAAGRPRGPL